MIRAIRKEPWPFASRHSSGSRILPIFAQGSPADGSTLSAIMPNYNHGRYIGRAIDALLSQERVPDEIIIVDDASTDDSLAVIQALAAKSSRIVIVSQPVNMGTNAALRAGLQRATGRYLVLVGADDWVLPGFCGLGMRMLTMHPDAGLFCGDTVLVDGETGRTIGYRPPARPRYRAGAVSAAECRQLLARMDNFIHTGGTIFRRDAIEAAGGLDDRLGTFADGYLTRKIALTFGFCYAPQFVACWCVFLSGVSRTTALNPTLARNALALYPARIAADPTFPEWYADVFRNRWRFATSRLALQADIPDFDFVRAMAVRSQIDRTVLQSIQSTLRGRIRRTAMLGWLWFRLRPYRLTDLILTALARKLEPLFTHPGSAGRGNEPR
jgi:glycosyltransferase involved in cell wall biosynthesis